MNSYDTQSIEEFSHFSECVYIDKKFLLLIPEIGFSSKMRNLLQIWEFNKIFSEGKIEGIKLPYQPKDNSIDSYLDSVENKESTGTPNKKPDEVKKNDYKAEIKAPTDVAAVAAPLIVSPEAPESPAPMETSTEVPADLKTNLQTDLTDVETKFLAFLKFIDKIFTNYNIKKTLDKSIISDKSKELYDFVKENKKLILRIDSGKFCDTVNYLVIHSLRSTIFSMIIAMQLKMPVYKIVELGVSCILHEIGMFRLPPQYYMNDTPLSEQGKKALLTHPVLSYNILKNASFPLTVCLGALEHHERLNGSGYPRGLTHENISLYGKIIAVACSYEAAISPRPYKEARNASSGIIDMLKDKDKQYDETILKALLFSISFYPVGIYVRLSNKKIAQVVDVNPIDPRFPIVQIYGETDASGKPKIVKTENKKLVIERPLSKEELKAIENP